MDSKGSIGPKGLIVHIFNVLLGVRAIKELNKWNVRITYFGCCVVVLYTEEGKLSHIRPIGAAEPPESIMLPHLQLCMLLYLDVSNIFHQRTPQLVIVKARRDLSNGVTRVPHSMDKKTEASLGIVRTTIITTIVIMSAIIFEHPPDTLFKKRNPHKSSHFADETKSQIGSD